jgi:hypothetical protein
MRDISISIRSLVLTIVGVLICSLLLSCGERNKQGSSSTKEAEWNQEQAELEYRVLQAELKLAQSNQAYLVLDFQRNQLEIKVQGATVWNYPMTIEQTATSELHEFSERFMGSQQDVVRPLLFKYLFAASSRTPDSILAIISSATMFPPELLQRTIPERFQLKWSDDIVLDIRCRGQTGIQVEKHYGRNPTGNRRKPWRCLRHGQDAQGQRHHFVPRRGHRAADVDLSCVLEYPSQD